MDGNSLKAHIRIAVAYFRMNDNEMALEFINKGLQLDANNAELVKLLHELKEKQMIGTDSHHKMYSLYIVYSHIIINLTYNLIFIVSQRISRFKWINILSLYLLIQMTTSMHVKLCSGQTTISPS